jgi:hypothetical protein
MVTEGLSIFWGNRLRALVPRHLVIYRDTPNRSSGRHRSIKVQGRERRWGVSISWTEEMKGTERGISYFKVSNAKEIHGQ